MIDIRQGGCLCGKARYEIDLAGHKTSNCHCRDCQKNHGAPYMTCTVVKANQLKWISKPVGEYSASAKAVRRFCSHCGTPLQWDGLDDADHADISTATLDDTSGITAEYEIYTRTRMPGVPLVEGASQHKARYEE